MESGHPSGSGRGHRSVKNKNYPAVPRPGTSSSSKKAPTDYDWDSDLADIPTFMTNLSLAEQNSQTFQVRDTEFTEAGGATPLTNFFEFASKDLPRIPPTNFGQTIGVWSNDIAAKALSDPVVATAGSAGFGAENDIWEIGRAHV